MQRIWLLFVVFFSYCSMNTEETPIEVQRVTLLDSIPSGSGLAISGQAMFIIGDDATAIFQLDKSGKVMARIPMLNADTMLQRISKPLKHDLESITIATIDGREHLLAFGSGSVSPYRDSLLVIDVADPAQQRWIPLGSLYRQLRTVSAKKELNVEGAVINEDRCYLFNRSGNEIFELRSEELFRLVESNGAYEVSDIKRYAIALPGGATLSGGCMIGKQVMFCASVENTPNAYDDGAIEGSFAGILDPYDGFKLLQFVRLSNGGIRVKDKLESVDVAGAYENGDLKVFGVADNDDGTSRLYELRVGR